MAAEKKRREEIRNAGAECWYVRSSSGSVYGPANANSLVEWSEAGRIMPDDEISPDKEQWYPADTVSDLKLDTFIVYANGSKMGPYNAKALKTLLSGGSAPSAVSTKKSTARQKVSLAEIAPGVTSAEEQIEPSPAPAEEETINSETATPDTPDAEIKATESAERAEEMPENPQAEDAEIAPAEEETINSETATPDTQAAETKATESAERAEETPENPQTEDAETALAEEETINSETTAPDTPDAETKATESAEGIPEKTDGDIVREDAAAGVSDFSGGNLESGADMLRDNPQEKSEGEAAFPILEGITWRKQMEARIRGLENELAASKRECDDLRRKLGTALADAETDSVPTTSDMRILKSFADEALESLRKMLADEIEKNTNARSASAELQRALHERIGQLERALNRNPGEPTQSEQFLRHINRQVARLQQELEAERKYHQADMARAESNEKALEQRCKILMQKESVALRRLETEEKHSSDYDSIVNLAARRGAALQTLEKEYEAAREQWKMMESTLMNRIDELEHGAGILFDSKQRKETADAANTPQYNTPAEKHNQDRRKSAPAFPLLRLEK